MMQTGNDPDRQEGELLPVLEELAEALADARYPGRAWPVVRRKGRRTWRIVAVTFAVAGLLGGAVWLLAGGLSRGPTPMPAPSPATVERAPVPRTPVAERPTVAESPPAEEVVPAPLVFLPMNLDEDMMDATPMETLAVIMPAIMGPDSAIMAQPEP